MRTSLTDLLRLDSPPVAISFVEEAPPGVPHVSSMEQAGCGYWRRAAAGEVFFTVADDHKRCPVGAHTHNVPLSDSEQQELMGVVETMVGLSYLKLQEVPQIPRRKTPLRVAVYAPLAAAPVPPDVVLVRGNARQPTCAVLPEAINSARTAASFGCVGNRVYTGAGENDAYFAIPASQLAPVEASLAVIVRANEELEKFHRARAGGLTDPRDKA